MHYSWSRALTVLFVALGTVAAGGWFAPASAAYQTAASRSWVPDGTVYAMARSGSTVYLGGDFTSLRDPATGASVARARLAAVDAGTGAVLSWNPGANSTVRALAVGSNGTVYAGGSFTSAAGTSASRVAAISSTGRAVSGFRASADNTVRDLVVDGTAVLVAGAFGNVNGTSRPRLARVSATTGAVDSAFNARVGGGVVFTAMVSGQSLFVGGAFTSLGGVARQFSGSVSRTTGAVTGWAPASQCSDCLVFDMATDGTRVYQAVGGPGGRAVALSASNGSRVWSRSGDGDVQAIAVSGGVVYAGGHFTMFNGSTRRQLVGLSASSGSVQGFAVTFTGSDWPGIWSILAETTALRIGGGFALAGNPAARYAMFPTA